MNYLWKKEEIEWLKENYGKVNIQECVEILNRSKHGIQVKACRLGLRDYTKNWKDKDIEILKENYKKGVLYCSKLLGKTKSSIMCQAKKYNLKVDPITKKENYSKAAKLRMKNPKVYISLRAGYKNYCKERFKKLQGKHRYSSDGYTYIRDNTHPNRNSNNYVAEHMKVMSEHLKRSIKENEIIHHIDLDKSNNKLNNLYLFKNKSEHNKSHWSINYLTKELLNKGAIRFKNGKYII